MLKMSSLKKGMAVLVCVAVIALFFPGVTHASTSPSNTKSPLLKKFISSFASVFPFINLNFYVMGADKDKPDDKNTNDKKNDPFKDHDNSLSKRRANGRD